MLLDLNLILLFCLGVRSTTIPPPASLPSPLATREEWESLKPFLQSPPGGEHKCHPCSISRYNFNPSSSRNASSITIPPPPSKYAPRNYITSTSLPDRKECTGNSDQCCCRFCN